MNELRVRRADRAPGIGADELFAQVAESVLTDRDLSDGAKVAYAVIKLSMVLNNNRVMCLSPMREIGRLMGVTEREARYRVAELEARGHVARERVRTIAGSPQGIRPLATTRTRNKRSDDRNGPADCNRNDRSTHPEQTFRAPGTDDPGDRNSRSAPLQREGESPEQQQDGGGPAAAVVVAPCSATTEEDPRPPTRGDFLGRLGADLGDALNPPPPRPRRARGKAPGAFRQEPPGGEVGNSVPDAINCTGEPTQPSRGENPIEHNAH